jgi:tetratricopeptide (TPR) repeat protein
MDDRTQALQAAFQLHQSGRLTEARSAYERLLAQYPNEPDALHLCGVLHTQQGDAAGGVDLIRRAIALRPDDPRFQFNLGIALSKAGDSPAAIDCYRKAVALAPDYGPALIALGEELLNGGKLDEAQALADRVLSLDGRSPGALTTLGTLAYIRGDHSAAKNIYQRALAADPGWLPAKNYLDHIAQGLFFGWEAGLQGFSIRQVFMSATVYLKRGLGRPLNILEIGSFMGASALTWAQAVDQLLDGPATLLCIDPWDESAKESPNARMTPAFKSGLAYKMFQTNIAALPATIKVDHIRGYSDAVLPTIADSSMDIVYIDGSHAYPHVASDVRQADRIVRPDGFVCGDDLELQREVCDETFARNNAMADYVADPRTGSMFHPGVTLAIGEFFGNVSCYEGFWIMQKTSAGYRPVSLKDAVGVLPRHWPPGHVDQLRKTFSTSQQLRAVKG